MKLILIENKNMDFPCVAEFTDGTRQMTNSVFRGIGIKYFHYYLASIGGKKVGDWILNVHSEYDHKELCKIDNEIELARYGHDKAKIEYSSDPKLGICQYDDIDSYFNGNHANKVKIAEQKFRKQWNDIMNDINYNTPAIESQPDKSIKEMMTEMENNKIQGGFFDLPESRYCNHPNHQPPSHLFIPQGKGYRHICPKCQKITTLVSPQITY